MKFLQLRFSFLLGEPPNGINHSGAEILHTQICFTMATILLLLVNHFKTCWRSWQRYFEDYTTDILLKFKWTNQNNENWTKKILFTFHISANCETQKQKRKKQKKRVTHLTESSWPNEFDQMNLTELWQRRTLIIELDQN